MHLLITYGTDGLVGLVLEDHSAQLVADGRRQQLVPAGRVVRLALRGALGQVAKRLARHLVVTRRGSNAGAASGGGTRSDDEI